MMVTYATCTVPLTHQLSNRMIMPIPIPLPRVQVANVVGWMQKFCPSHTLIRLRFQLKREDGERNRTFMVDSRRQRTGADVSSSRTQRQHWCWTRVCRVRGTLATSSLRITLRVECWWSWRERGRHCESSEDCRQTITRKLSSTYDHQKTVDKRSPGNYRQHTIIRRLSTNDH